jgi:L-amino acid N-acyltransferase YncA
MAEVTPRLIRPAQPEDAAAIAAIYNHYIINTTITFEEQAVSEADMRLRLEEVVRTHPWLVYESDGAVIGYAYGHPFHARSAYRRTVECAIYLDHNHIGQGVGRKLYQHLLDLLSGEGYHVALGIVALPNEPSQRLHEALGFEKAGELREVGYKFGRWIDVGHWQLLLGPA